MAYQRPPFRTPTPFSAFAIQNPMPIPGQFFNTGPPRPLIPAAGFRLPPQHLPPNLPRPRLPLQTHQNKFRLAAPPKTTVFVGNISEEIETNLLQKICEECGKVNSFRRLEGANGKLQAFGFCEYNHPDATRRALRLLNGFNLGGKPLLIKVEDKVLNQIQEYMNGLRQENGLLPLPPGSQFPISDEDRDGDIIARKIITEMVEAVDKNLLREPDPKPEELPKEQKKFSSSSESEEDKRKEEREKLSRRRKHHRSRSRSPKRTRSRSRSPRRRRDRDSRSSRDDRSNKLSHRKKHSESVIEDESTRRERQKAKEREAAYQRRIKKWEEKEIRFAREVEKDREKERQRQKNVSREAKKLQTFHEDYDDDVDDAKYYRGDTLIQRRRLFDQQLEKDLEDRNEEIAEFEQIKSEILASHPDKAKNVDEEARKRAEKEENKINIKLGLKLTSPSTFTPDDGDSRPSTFKLDSLQTNAGWESVPSPSASTKIPSLKKKINVQTAGVVKNELFDDGEDEDEARKRKKLQPFTISSEERIAILTPDERKRLIRDLIDKIPKSRDHIFAYPLKWEHLDDMMVETRIRPWVMKKVKNFIGEEEPALVTFISDCVKKRTDPKKLVLDLSMVFDEEAESFITKMWRLLIYETEARSRGLSALSNNSST